MNPKEKLAALLRELQELREKSKAGTLTKEEGEAFDTKVIEARDLKASIDETERRQADASALDEMDQFLNKGTGSRARAVTSEMREDARDEKRDTRKGIGDALLESEGFQRFKATGYHKGLNSGPVDARSFFHKDSPVDVTGMSPEELRTLIYSGALPSSPAFIAPNRIPGIYTPDMPALTVRSAFLNLQTSQPVIQFFRELTFTNNAAFVAEATATGGSSGLKAESALTFEADTAIVETLAHWIAINNATLDDVPQMRGIVEGRLIDGVKLVEDEEIIDGNGTPPNIKGLLNVTGVQDLDSTYFGANPVEGAGDPNEDFDRITRARTLIRIVGRARPSFVFLNPADLERFVTITDANKQYYSGSPFGDLALTRMRGLQVIETEALDEGTAIVGDGRMAAVFDRMAATVTAGWQDQQFVRNQMTLLAEERIAFAVFRPAAFAIVELAG